MGVTGTSFVEGGTQANGLWRYVTAEYTFHTGEVVTISNYKLPVGEDASIWVAAQTVDIEARIIEDEQEALLGQFEVLDPDTLTSEDPVLVVPQHPDTDSEFDRIRRFRRRLLRRIIKKRSILLVRALLIPIYEWIQAQGYNAAQIKAYLNLTQAQYDAIKARLDAIQANLAFIDADTPEELE